MTYLLVFDSTHAALAAQDVLQPINPRLIPTPRTIKADCGMALRFEATNDAEAIELARSVEDARGQAHLYAEGSTLLADI